MSDNLNENQEEIYSKVLRAGRRTYFFDVRSTKANDYYLTITESKKFTHDDGSFRYQKHKIYLYKEDFSDFQEMLKNATKFIVNEKGTEVISERHQKDYKREDDFTRQEAKTPQDTEPTTESFTDISFDDI